MSTNTIAAILSFIISLVPFTMTVLSEKAKKALIDKIDHLTLLVDSSHPIKILKSFSNINTSMRLEALAYTLTGFIAAFCLLLFDHSFYGDYAILIRGTVIGFLLWTVTFSAIRVIKKKSSIIIKKISSDGRPLTIAKRIGLFLLIFGLLAVLIVVYFELAENLADTAAMWTLPILIVITIPYAICLYILSPPILLVVVCFITFGLLEIVLRLLSRFLWWSVGHKKGALVIFAAFLTLTLSLLINILKIF